MNLLERIHTTVDRGAFVPGVRHFVEASYRKEFVHNRERNLFHGVFASFETAAASASRYGVSGYDNDASADLYLGHMRADAHDYPAMFWLSKSFSTGLRRVLDVGGSIGIKYYAFKTSLPVPDDVEWTVVDVPTVVAKGKALSSERGVSGALHFSAKMSCGEGADILFASGSLQYLPLTLGAYLAEWKRKPARIIVNITPIHESLGYFTVNSIGTAFCPYRVQTQAALVSELAGHGYVMKDTWANRGKDLHLPLHPELSLNHYRGFCFDLPGHR